MPDGGTTHLTVELGDEAIKPAVIIKIRNEGVGMFPQVLQRVTEPYLQY
jgi:hypothetical protein